MKIKCPFCRNVYDPEACNSTCPACNKKLLVTVFKKKPEGKPGGGPATVIRPPTTITPKPPAPPPTPAPVSAPPPAGPVTEFVAPKAPVVVPVIKPPAVAQPPALGTVPPHAPAERKKATIKVEASAQVPAVSAPVSTPPPTPKQATQIVAVPPPESPAPVASPAPHAEKKHAHHGHGHAKADLDVVISIQRGESAEWDAVIRVPVQIFRLANLIPARAREAITSEGIDLEELRKAVEHVDHVGRLLDIQTQAERVHIAIEPHA